MYQNLVSPSTYTDSFNIYISLGRIYHALCDTNEEPCIHRLGSLLPSCKWDCGNWPVHLREVELQNSYYLFSTKPHTTKLWNYATSFFHITTDHCSPHRDSLKPTFQPTYLIIHALSSLPIWILPQSYCFVNPFSNKPIQVLRYFFLKFLFCDNYRFTCIIRNKAEIRHLLDPIFLTSNLLHSNLNRIFNFDNKPPHLFRFHQFYIHS